MTKRGKKKLARLKGKSKEIDQMLKKETNDESDGPGDHPVAMETKQTVTIATTNLEAADSSNNGDDGDNSGSSSEDNGGEACSMIGVKISKVKNGDFSFICDSETDPSVTIVSVEQVKEMQHMNKEKSENQSVSESCVRLENQSLPNVMKENQSNEQKQNPLSPRNLKPNQSANSDDDSPELPSASFCLRSRSQNQPPVKKTLRKYRKTAKSIDDSGSFKCDSQISDSYKEVSNLEQKNNIRKNDIESAGSDELNKDLETIAKSDTVCEKEDKIKEKTRSLKRFTFKRKLPKFSDSDSEDSLPGKKAAKVDSSNFVTSEKMKITGRKMTISNSFFSGDGGKVQPKLSFFVNKHSKENSPQVDAKSFEADGSNEDDNADDIQELIKENIAVPRVKNEHDLLLRDELKTIR